jgi:hypothetical protein
MKVVLIDNLKSNIDDSHVRWYLSSQEIWIGQEKNYEEIEESIGKSYGSFKWLFSAADTILFDKENLKLTSSVVKVNEPINVTERKLEVINSREGTIKLVEASNFSCELGDCTTYYSNEDTLVSCRSMFKLDNQIIALDITKDFSFIVKGYELVGWILKNSSRHLIGDEMNCIDSEIQSTDFIKITLVKYLKLIKKLNDELTSDEEEKLTNDFKALYERIKTCTLTPVVAIKESILNVLDFM